MKKYLSLTLLMIFAGCNSWMDITPEDQRSSSGYWQSREEVENTTIACYVNMRNCLLKMLEWGELRGNVLNVLPMSNDATQDELDIRSLNITSDNTVAKWKDFYKVINTANSVISNAKIAQLNDPTFSDEQMQALVAENIFMRSLCYFYLVRTFGEVPLVLDPYITDEQSYMRAKSSERTIIEQLTSDLEANMKYMPEKFSSDALGEWQNKGRGTRWAALALLADIYLWDGNYEKASSTCDKVISSNNFGILTGDNWFKNFYPGNTTEIIFQLKYDHMLNQRNTMYAWFYSSVRFELSNQIADKFANDPSDIRGLGASYYYDSGNKIWKYIGAAVVNSGSPSANFRASNDRSPNWIFYRYADIILMKAEALVMKDGYNETNYLAAMALVNRIKTRAGVKQLDESSTIQSSEKEFLLTILDERTKEFVAEGKNWFDILRIGRRDNYRYREVMIDILLENIAVENKQIYKTKLSGDPNGYFLPIYYDEIQSSGGVLVQNSYYVN